MPDIFDFANLMEGEVIGGEYHDDNDTDNPATFKRHVGRIFEAFGCRVDYTGGEDFDLTVYKGGKRGIAQCCFPAGRRAVSDKALRAFRQAMIREGVTLGFLVTAAVFSPQARRAAAYAPRVILFDGQKLKELTEQLLPQLSSTPPLDRVTNTHHVQDINERVEKQIDVSFRQRGGCLTSFGVMFGSIMGASTAVGIISVLLLLLLLACCIFVLIVTPSPETLYLLFHV